MTKQLLSLRPQAVEHGARGKAVGDLAGRRLEIADGDAGARAEQAVRLIEGGLIVALATREPKRFEASLQDVRALLSGS